MLNNFTDREAIEIAIEVRDELPMDLSLPLKRRWREKDALAQVINLAEKVIKAKEEKANEDN